jgi:hypothetical protein
MQTVLTSFYSRYEIFLKIMKFLWSPNEVKLKYSNSVIRPCWLISNAELCNTLPITKFLLMPFQLITEILSTKSTYEMDIWILFGKTVNNIIIFGTEYTHFCTTCDMVKVKLSSSQQSRQYAVTMHNVAIYSNNMLCSTVHSSHRQRL